MQETKITDGGLLYYDENFFSELVANELFRVIKEKTPWKQETGRFHKPFPRLTAWYADPGLTYSYSGVTHHGLAWESYLLQIKQRVETASGKKFNSLLLNLYRDGKDSISWHTDAEPELGTNPAIASVSLGAEREFLLKHKHNKETINYSLKNGSLLIMAGTSQHHWLHSVPKTKNEIGERINLTFRNIRL